MYRNEVQIQNLSFSSARPKGRNIQVEISSSDSEESKLCLPGITTKNLSKLNASYGQKQDRRSLSASPNKPFLGSEGLQSNSTAS